MSSDLWCYKFKAIDKFLVESLVTPSLYFAKPNTLNDPFDCHLNLKGAFKIALSSATGDQHEFLSEVISNPEFFETWESTLSDVGVCSFSMHVNEVLIEKLLWSHYADQHKGVCLEYQLPEAFIRDTDFQLTAGGVVDYHSGPLVDFLLKAPTDREEFVKQLALIYLKTKSPAWHYEKEVRLIRHKHGVFNIRGEFLRQVCFGLQTAEADKRLIHQLARDYCGCTTFFHLARTEDDFGLALKPYPDFE